MHVLCCVGHQQSSPPQAPLFPPGSPEDLLQSCTHFLRGELTTLIEEQAQLATGAFHAGSATALRFRYGSHLVLVPELRKAPPSRRVSFLHPSASRRPHPPPSFITRLKCALPLCTPPPPPAYSGSSVPVGSLAAPPSTSMGSTHSPCLDVVGGLGTPPVVPRDAVASSQAAAVECSPLARALAACMPQARVPSPCGSGAGSGSGSGSMGECDVGTLGPSPDLSGAMTDGACHVFFGCCSGLA